MAQIKPKLSFEETRSCLHEVHSELLQPLPEFPQLISQEIRDALPYSIPLENRLNTRVVVEALRKGFKFDKLNDNYFVHTLVDIPEDPSKLHPSVRDLFPITERAELRELSNYRQKLKQFYKFDRIPAAYFNVPEKNEPLPTTPQELNSATRHLFPCDPKNDTEFRSLVKILREHYSFKRIPKDFFITKDKLPTDPALVKVKQHYNFPIEDINLAKAFIAEIESKYRFTIPLPTHYMTVNPTDKPPLPEKPELVQNINLTTPIRSPKLLVEIARKLREKYFFYKIPDSWIDIPVSDGSHTKDNPRLPNELAQVMELSSQIPELQHLNLPIKRYEDISPTEDLLHKYFIFNTLPLHFTDVPDLPEPTWDILNNYAPRTQDTQPMEYE